MGTSWALPQAPARRFPRRLAWRPGRGPARIRGQGQRFPRGRALRERAAQPHKCPRRLGCAADLGNTGAPKKGRNRRNGLEKGPKRYGLEICFSIANLWGPFQSGFGAMGATENFPGDPTWKNKPPKRQKRVGTNNGLEKGAKSGPQHGPRRVEWITTLSTSTLAHQVCPPNTRQN